MRARYYDPALGRFSSEDPSKSGSNWFVYCDNNPVDETDSTGKTGNVLMNGMLSIVTDWSAAAFGLILGEASVLALTSAVSWMSIAAGTALAMASIFCFGIATGNTISQSLWAAVSAETLGLFGATYFTGVSGALKVAQAAGGGIAYSAVAGAYLYCLVVAGAAIGDDISGY